MKPRLVLLTLKTREYDTIYKNIDKATIIKIEGGIQFDHNSINITWHGDYKIAPMPKEKKDGRTTNQVGPSNPNN